VSVHFTGLVGVQYDWDLIPFWIDHYSRFNFDSYTVFLQSDEPLCREWKSRRVEVFRRRGWQASFADMPSYYSGAKADLIFKFVQTLRPSDHVVVADTDEFQDMPPSTYYETICAHDMVVGRLQDCYGERLTAARHDMPLEMQYGVQGENLDECLNHCRELPLNRTKIMASRCSLNVAYSGSHVLIGAKPRRVHEGNTVLHYAFRACLPWKMARRRYNTPETIRAVCRRFGLEYHPAMGLCRNLRELRTNIEGWMPGARAVANG